MEVTKKAMNSTGIKTWIYIMTFNKMRTYKYNILNTKNPSNSSSIFLLNKNKKQLGFSGKCVARRIQNRTETKTFLAKVYFEAVIKFFIKGFY